MIWRWIALAVFFLLYLRSPIDLIPDRVGLIGLLDDLVVLLTSIWWARQQQRQRGPSASRRTLSCMASSWPGAINASDCPIISAEL